MICTGAKIVGSHELWSEVFKIFDLKLDPSLSRHLKKRMKIKVKDKLFKQQSLIKRIVVQNAAANMQRHVLASLMTSRLGHDIKQLLQSGL